jgi:exodeoxyribonuclease VII large subunit
MAHKMLALSHDCQELELSPVFVEFPNRIERLRSDVDDLRERLDDGVSTTIQRYSSKLDRFRSQLSPVALTSKLGTVRTAVAVINEKQTASMRRILNKASERLALGMASLDALSPLSVMKRGYSITQKQTGEVVHDVAAVKEGEKLDIRLAKGRLKTEVVSRETE